MTSRAFVFAGLLAAVAVLSSPIQGDPQKYKLLPPPAYGGFLTRDSTCPLATHLLTRRCYGRPPEVYVVFKRMKGVHRFENGGFVEIHAPTIDATSCSLPVVEADDIVWRYPPLSPCPGEP
jgi:hypothetical protein